MPLSAVQFRKTPEWLEQHEKFRDNPILMARTLFPKMAHLDTPEFHLELQDLYLDYGLKYINAIAPRDHAKTTLVGQIFVIHHLVFSEDPFVVIISKTARHAKRVLGAIKLMVSEPMFQYMYGHIVTGWNKSTALKWNEEEVKFRSGQAVYATGTGQQIRGIKEGYVRPSLIVLDDPEDAENTKTAERMEGNWKYLTKEMVPALRQGGRCWVIGTPLHQRCMVFRLKKRIDWESRHYSAEKDPENEISLWPERHSWEDLQVKRRAAETDNSLSDYYQEYLCKIIPDAKRLFRDEDLRYWEGDVVKKGRYSYLKWREVTEWGEPIPNAQWKEERCDVYTGVDPATSTSDTADYFVIFHIAVTVNNDRFILPYFRDRVRPSAAIEHVIAEFKKWNSIRVSIETSGQQDIYRDILRNRDNVYIPGLAVKHNPKEKKEKRHLEQLEPWFSSQQVFLQPDMTELKDEMFMWPKGSHDDLLDGAYYAFLHAKPARKTVITAQKKLKNHNKSDFGDQSWMLS